MYTGSTNHCLQKERSLIYAEKTMGGPIQEERKPTRIQGERDPSCIQGERSHTYTERAKPSSEEKVNQ